MTKVKNELPLSLCDLEISDPSYVSNKNKLAMTMTKNQIKEKRTDLVEQAQVVNEKKASEVQIAEKQNETVKQIGDLFMEMNSYVAGPEPQDRVLDYQGQKRL